MSKKKISGSTMTLKDFHGGSIPSDIPLPSAPGVIARPSDRPGERQTSWGPSMGVRSDHRLRPSSSGSMRNLDDNKTPFLTSTANIGRNFDEDERKPLDGGTSVPRRIVSDDSIGPSVVRVEPRGDGGKVSGGVPSLGPVVPQTGGGGGSSYSARVVEGAHSGGVGGGGVGSRPNAWGVRKEVPVVGEVGSSWNGQSTVSKFAQASALDKISSGRWQTKPVPQQVDVEVIRQSDSPNSLHRRESDSCGGMNIVSEREYYEATLSKHAERGLSIEEGTRGGFMEAPGVETVHSPVQSPVLFTNDGQPAYPDGTHGSPLFQQPPEVSERPKLKLLPRTKPLEVQEPSGVDYRLGLPNSIDNGHSVAGNIHGNANHVKSRPSSSEASTRKSGVSSSEAAGLQAVERPKLNLKPRLQPVHPSDGSTERERKALFGGARPRELVLKERGVDDVVNYIDEAQAPTRTKNDGPRAEVAPAPVPAITSRQGERFDNHSIDQRTGKIHEKRGQKADIQRADMQRKNWRNDNWRSGRDSEKHQQERQPSPESWRKPVQPNDNSGLRFGKAVSAVDLAQAFSKSVSSPKPVDQFSGQRGLPGQKGIPVRSQVPFSRLAGSTTRPQINGY